MEMNIIECLKERRDFDRTENAAHIQLNCKKRDLFFSANLKRISPSGLICYSGVGLDPGELVSVHIPRMNGVFEAGARVVSLKKVLRRYELELKFLEIRRDILTL